MDSEEILCLKTRENHSAGTGKIKRSLEINPDIMDSGNTPLLKSAQNTQSKSW